MVEMSKHLSQIHIKVLKVLTLTDSLCRLHSCLALPFYDSPMQLLTIIRSIVITFIFSLTLVHGQVNNDFRVWALKSGDKITAKLVGFQRVGKKTYLILGVKDGTSKNLALDQLSAADQQWAKLFHQQKSHLTKMKVNFEHMSPRQWHTKKNGVISATLKSIEEDEVTLSKNGRDWTTSVLNFGPIDYSYLRYQVQPSITLEIAKARALSHRAKAIAPTDAINVYEPKHPTRIEVEPATGKVSYIKSSKVQKTTSVVDLTYVTAVKNKTLHVFFGDGSLQPNEEGKLPIPVVVSGYPLLGQQGFTCWESYFREWVLCLTGNEQLQSPPLKNLKVWITATKLGLWDVEQRHVDQLTKATTGDNSQKRALLDVNSGFETIYWLENFLLMKLNYHHVPLANKSSTPYLDSLMQLPRSDLNESSPKLKLSLGQHLLLGHGVLLITDLGKNHHLCSMVASDQGEPIVSSWAHTYRLTETTKKLGNQTQHALIILPNRDKLGHCSFSSHKGANQE